MRKNAALSFLLLLALALAARAADEEITNTTCPVMEGEEVDPEIFVDYKGKRVYFCCDDCVEQFNDTPEKFLAMLPQFADAASPAPATAEAEDGEDEHPFGVLHFVFVHFPVALSAVAALAALLGIVFRGAFFRNAVTFTLLLAALLSIPTYLTGGEAEEARGRMAEGLRERVDRHETLGTVSMYALLGAAALHVLSLGFSRSVPLRWVALLAVLAVAGIVGYTGYLGGEVSVGPGHLDAFLPW
jgi:uncharacterized membrane protein/YHS domain-containing protein